MTRETLRARLSKLMRDKFHVQVQSLDDHLRLNEDLRIDSIMIVQLVVFIELDLLLQVPDETIDPRTFSTVGTLLDFMQKLQPLPPEASDEKEKVGRIE